MVLLQVKQYYPQTDSATGHGDRMCFSSTCAMAVKYLLPDALKGSNADDDYLRTVLKYGDTTFSTSQIKACQQYGVFATFYQKGTRRDLLNELKAGYPVAVGILHKGHVSNPVGGGHWMLLIGDDGEHGIFHDPYGEMDNVNGGYVTIGNGGKNVKYTWHNWLKRWEVEGKGTGWFMTFRPTNTPQPSTPVARNTLMGLARFTEQAFTGESGNGNTIRNGQIGDIYGIKVYVSTNADTATTSGTGDVNPRVCLMAHPEFGVLVEQLGIRVQTQYKQEYLGTLLTADTLYGVGELRDTSGVALIIPG